MKQSAEAQAESSVRVSASEEPADAPLGPGPTAATPARVLALQRLVGNAAVSRYVESLAPPPPDPPPRAADARDGDAETEHPADTSADGGSGPTRSGASDADVHPPEGESADDDRVPSRGAESAAAPPDGGAVPAPGAESDAAPPDGGAVPAPGAESDAGQPDGARLPARGAEPAAATVPQPDRAAAAPEPATTTANATRAAEAQAPEASAAAEAVKVAASQAAGPEPALPGVAGGGPGAGGADQPAVDSAAAAIRPAQDAVLGSGTTAAPQTASIAPPVGGSAIDQVAPDAGDRPAVPSVSFAEPDVASLLPPPEPGEPPDDRRRAEDELQAVLAADREHAQQAVDAFVSQRQATTDELAATRPSIDRSIAAAGASAVATIDVTADARISTLRASVADGLAAAQAHAARARGEIEARHESSTAEIRAATERVRAALTQASEATSQRAASAETTQMGSLNALYTRLESDFHAAADQAGALALSEAAKRASTYRAGRINKDDSFLDGPLTDNRCEAQADAAEKVGASYRDELRKEGDKQAGVMRDRKPTDEGAVRHVTTETRTSLATVLAQAMQGIDDSERQSLASAAAARTQLLGQIDSTQETVARALAEHEAGQVAQLQTLAAQRKAAVQQAVAETTAGLGQAVQTAVSDVDGALALLVSQLSGGELPDPELLDATLADAGDELDAQLAAMQNGLREQSDSAVAKVTDAGAQAATGIMETADAALRATQETATGAADALSSMADAGRTGLQGIARGHSEAVQRSQSGYTTATQSLLDGQTASYARINDNLTQGAQRNVESVRRGLTDVVVHDMQGVIADEAGKARAQVQPRWKSVVKWIIILAIVLVVAIVLGPLVVGFAAGAATALGASALVGRIVGGALVGAATSAVITVVDNAFAGRDLTTGIGQAMLVGAIGGGLGGAFAGLMSGPIQGMSVMARYGIQVGADMAIDTGINVFTGNLTWENFGTSLVMSAIVSGVTAHPRASGFSEGLTSRSFGAGYDVGANVRSRATGTGGPGSLGAVGIDAAHVNVGDSAGANSPYAGRWDMAGGGHNAGEFRGRIAGDAAPPYEFRSRTVAEDPVTGVAIDQVTRNQVQNAPGGPRPVVDAAGVPQTKTKGKSLFPPSMDRPAIQAAGQRGLELAVAGAPGTEHTPPPAGGGNGRFSAVITTPEGHPVRVDGFYTIDPSGQPQIKTVYPATDLPNLRVPPVPGSRTRVPGAATPPDYDPGDDEEQDR